MKFKDFSDEQKHKTLLDTSNFIKEMKEVFDIDCFLCGGILLGSQREKDLINHDSDIDLYFISKYLHPKLEKAIEEKRNIWRYFSSLNRGRRYWGDKNGQSHIWFSEKQNNHGNPGQTNYVDLFGSWRQSNESFIMAGSNFRFYECKIAECILPLKTITLKGVDLLIPNKTDEFLNFFYGKCWRTSFITPEFPPGEIEQAIKDEELWEYFIGSKDCPKKLVGGGRIPLGCIKLNKDGTTDWSDNMYPYWKINNDNIILYNKTTSCCLYRTSEEEYESNEKDTYIKIKKINTNTDISKCSFYNKEVCAHWFKE